MNPTSKGWSFGYDANGNMNSYKGNSISWTSYNLPVTINGAGQSSQFAYGPNRNRWRQIASYPSGTETTIYVGGILEKVTVPSGTAYRHYIGAGSAKVIYTRWTTGTINTKYVTSDHLGSSTAVMDGAGAALASLSFGSYGARRGSAWTGTPTAGDWTQIGNSTRQGFTGHEGLDNINFVHMNGRVYEPILGRFISADPFMPGSLGSQASNRYAYVGNQVQSLIDPTGFQDRDVTEAQPRVFPQCAYQIANIAIDCPYQYGWRWDRDPFDLWWQQEMRAENWARWMTETNGGGRTFTPRPNPNPRPTPVPSDPESVHLETLQEQEFGAHEIAELLMPGYDLGTCMSSRGDCTGTDWAFGVVGVIPGGKAGAIAAKGIFKFARRADAAEALARKLGALVKAQAGAARTRTLSDGRIRYYSAEVAARMPGPTRGASLVTEYNPRTGQVRQWMESYDQGGNAIRVHPKMIDGHILDSPHYPPIGSEIGP